MNNPATSSGSSMSSSPNLLCSSGAPGIALSVYSARSRLFKDLCQFRLLSIANKPADVYAEAIQKCCCLNGDCSLYISPSLYASFTSLLQLSSIPSHMQIMCYTADTVLRCRYYVTLQKLCYNADTV